MIQTAVAIIEAEHASVAVARVICLRGARLGPLCIGEGLCRVANAETLCRVETGRL